VIFTIGQNTFEEKLGKDFLTKSLINTNMKDKDLEPFKDLNNTALFRGGASYADAITFGADVLDKKLVSEFSIVKGKKVVPFNGWDSDLTEYLDLYNDLAAK
jgi:starch synthase